MNISKNDFIRHYKKYMFLVGTLGQSLFYLQGIKIFCNKSACDVSFPGFLMGFIAVTSWMIYGILIKDKVVTISNIVAVIGALLVLAGILVHG